MGNTIVSVDINSLLRFGLQLSVPPQSIVLGDPPHSPRPPACTLHPGVGGGQPSLHTPPDATSTHWHTEKAWAERAKARKDPRLIPAHSVKSNIKSCFHPVLPQASFLGGPSRPPRTSSLPRTLLTRVGQAVPHLIAPHFPDRNQETVPHPQQLPVRFALLGTVVSLETRPPESRRVALLRLDRTRTSGKL